MATILSLIKIIGELIALGAEYLPSVFKYLMLAYSVYTKETALTPEVQKQVDDAHADVSAKLTAARADREAEAAAMVKVETGE